ncbi:hypothetical protein R6Q59_011843 [Mikania micrantha]
MSVNLYSQQTEPVSHDHIAKIDLKFTCMISLKNDKLRCLNISFSSLTFKSLFNSVVLLECTSSRQKVPVLQLNISMPDEGENQLHFTLPCVNIWLFFSDWSKVVDFFNSCLQLPKTAVFNNEELNKSNLDRVYQDTDNTSSSPTLSSYLYAEDTTQHLFSLIVKSDLIGIKIFVPILSCWRSIWRSQNSREESIQGLQFSLYIFAK